MQRPSLLTMHFNVVIEVLFSIWFSIWPPLQPKCIWITRLFCSQRPRETKPKKAGRLLRLRNVRYTFDFVRTM